MRTVVLCCSLKFSLRQTILAILVLVAAAATSLNSQTLRGQVVDSVNAEPLVGLDVVLLDAQRDTVAITKAGADGRFEFSVPAGKYTLCLRCIGHRPKQVPVDVPADTVVLVRLGQISVPPSM